MSDLGPPIFHSALPAGCRKSVDVMGDIAAAPGTFTITR